MIDTIVNSFDIWTDAQGIKSRTRVKSVDNISLEGIAGIRELILDLAFRGKLISQNINDEPASTLLKKINKELTEKFEEEYSEKLSRDKSTIDPTEFHNAIPKNWIWCELQDLAILFNGKAHEQFIDDNGKYQLINSSFVSSEGKVFKTISNQLTPLTKGDIAIVMSDVPEGKALVKCFLVEDDDKYSLNQRIGGIAASRFLDRKYLMLVLNRNKYYLQYDDGKKQTNLKKIQILSCPIPLAPFEEQKRIVAKVDELMALCDKLEMEQFNNLKTHQVLVKTLLETLTQAADANELQASWERMSSHFDTLFCTEDSIDQLKQTILQLAVMGKLVKQDPNDEPASELLKKIEKEKQRLIEEGKLKKQSQLPEISEEEKPFELPKGWEWTRLGEIGIGSTGKTPSTSVSKYFGGNIPFIGPGQITSEGKITEADKTLTEEGSVYSTIAEEGDILMVCIGGTIGKCAIVKYRTSFNQQINSMHPLFYNTNFLYDTMNATYFQRLILSKATGSATPIINRSKWEEILIPVPSVSEQMRIVLKIDELFEICESLKKRIRISQDLKFLLSKTIVEKAVV